MYVCVCNAIKDSELRKAARLCNGSAEEIYGKMGKSPNCGQCLNLADRILDEERCDLVAI